LKIGIVEPEETSFARQLLSIQVSVARDTEATMEEFFGTTFYFLAVQSGYKESSVENRQSSRVVAGLNTCTVALQVVGGDEKGSL
jgi:hypothetical protein